jgi:hypothetical protein
MTKTKLKTIGAIGALLLGTSTLALAQQTAPSTTQGTGSQGTTMSPSVGQPQGGSHTPMATPQNAPPSRTMGQSNTAPGPQTASKMTEQDVKKRLEDAGYSSVSNIKPSKDGYTARAMMSGKRVTVDVDGNGQIMAK